MIYLASPYTHAEASVMQQRHDVAFRITKELLEDEVLVYSPIVHCHPVAVQMAVEPPHAFWIAHCMVMLSACKAIVVLPLPGWRESKGIQQEILHAVNLGLKIAHFDDPKLVAEGLSELVTPDQFTSYITGILKFDAFNHRKETPQ